MRKHKEKTQLSVHVPPELRKELAQEAERQDRGLSNLIRQILAEWMEARK
jgi:predicted HicB family RNase H-like nuclease